MKKYKDQKSSVPQKDDILNRKFFKWLGNMSKSDHHKTILHMLNPSGPKWRFKYPKVTMNQQKTVLDFNYNTKEWMEWRKRK